MAAKEESYAVLNGKTWALLVLLFGIMMSAQGYIIVRVDSSIERSSANSSRLAAIEANRFTSGQAMSLIATLKQEFPQDWVKAEFVRQEAQDIRLQTQIDELKAMKN